MRSDISPYLYHTKIALVAIAFLGCTLPGSYSSAQTTPTEESIIVPPAAPSGSIVMTGVELKGENLQAFLNQVAASLGSNIQGLEQNLRALSQLNTEDNQRRLNTFGTAYGNVPTLGTNLVSGLTALDLRKFAESAGEINGQLPKLVSDFTDAEVELSKTGPSQDDLKAAMDAKNPGEAIGEMVKSGAISPQFQTAQTNMFHLVFKLMMVNNAVCSLNSNLDSVRSTYENILTLGSQPPSVLVSMKNLGLQIGMVDNLAVTQFGGLSQLTDTFRFVDANLEALHNAGGLKKLVDPKDPTIKALGQFDDQLERLYSKLNQTNSELGRTLGTTGGAKSFIQFDQAALKELADKSSAKAVKSNESKGSATADSIAKTQAILDENTKAAAEANAKAAAEASAKAAANNKNTPPTNALAPDKTTDKTTDK